MKTKAKSKPKTKAQLIGKIGWFGKELSAMESKYMHSEHANFYLRLELKNAMNGMPNLRELQRENVALKEQSEYLS